MRKSAWVQQYVCVIDCSNGVGLWSCFSFIFQRKFVFSWIPWSAKRNVTGKPVVWSGTAEIKRDEKRDVEISDWVDKVSFWIMAALYSVFFLWSEATWSKLAALLPQNNVFCLQEEVSARSWNSSFTSQADWLIAARACGRKSEDNISAAWLYETCLHGEETSHLLRLEPRLTNIPCTPFNDVTHARCQNPHAELTHPPSKVRMPWTGCTYCWSLWRAVFTQMLSLACQPCTKAQPEEHLPGQGRVWCFAAPGTLCLPGLGRAHEEKWKGRAKHLQVLVLCKDI